MRFMDIMNPLLRLQRLTDSRCFRVELLLGERYRVISRYYNHRYCV